MRIMIFGRPGSGKSTFALKLSQQLHLPLYHLDRYFFTRDWIERDYSEFLQIQKEIVDKDSWIIDGNAIRSLEMRYQRADIVIYFCYPKLKCLWRIIKRRFLSKNHRIKDKAEGCTETIHWSLIKYLWTYETRVQSQIIELRKKYPTVKFYVVRNDQDLSQSNDQFFHT